MNAFRANGLPVLIGSLPLDSHAEAVRLVSAYTPEIPLWVQLPVHREEMMIAQFMPGMPGIARGNGKIFIDSSGQAFDADLLQFYEEYFAVDGNDKDLLDSRFILTEDTARGFFAFINHLKTLDAPPTALKGQITGPVTFCTGISDQTGRAVFYDDRIRDAAVVLLAQKARWQVRRLSRFGSPVMVFIDEPALAGFGSSAFIGIDRGDVTESLAEVIEAIHIEGGLAGVHVCANADWSLLLESSVDIISFDAYSHFDRFILYAEQVRAFVESDRILAWGIVPTSPPEAIKTETAPSLADKWLAQAEDVEALGIDRSKLFAQTLITPSCGTGSLSRDHATRVLELTREVSNLLRARVV
jgi:methionine synthase II (cobalamin-independent)